MTARSTRLTLFALVAALLLVSLAAPARAQQGTADLRSDADYVYGQSMRFRLRSADLGQIDRITLYFRPNTSADSFAVDIPPSDGPGIDVSYSLDLTQTRLAPFSTISYWWELERADGVQLRVPEQVINYVDDQFSWQNLSKTAEVGGGTLAVHWTGDNPAIGGGALALIEDMIPRLGAVLPLTQIIPFDTYIYPSTADLASAMRLAGLDYQPGRSYPELGALLTTAVNDSTAEEELRSGISRELTELLLYQALGDRYVAVPAWLRVGLAGIAAGQANERQQATLDAALQEGKAIPLADLCVAGPESVADPNLFYAESDSFVRHIQAQYGDQAVKDLVSATAEGSGCRTALEAALGQPLDAIEQGWQRAAMPVDEGGRSLGQGIIWLLLLVGGFGLAALLLLRPKQN